MLMGPLYAIPRAKLKAAAWSTLATWALVVAMVAAAVIWSGNFNGVAAWWGQGLRAFHLVELIVGLIAVTIFLVLCTWKRMVGFTADFAARPGAAPDGV